MAVVLGVQTLLLALSSLAEISQIKKSNIRIIHIENITYQIKNIKCQQNENIRYPKVKCLKKK